MNNIFIIAIGISVVFLIIKFIETKMIEKDNKPLKLLIRDAILVYFSVVVGYFIINQIHPMINNVSESLKTTPVFTGNPEF